MGKFSVPTYVADYSNQEWSKSVVKLYAPQQRGVRDPLEPSPLWTQQAGSHANERNFDCLGAQKIHLILRFHALCNDRQAQGFAHRNNRVSEIACNPPARELVTKHLWRCGRALYAVEAFAEHDQ
jgi:hypothetical protein